MVIELSQAWCYHDEVRHEELVRDQSQPSECESWVVVWVQVLQQVSQVV